MQIVGGHGGVVHTAGVAVLIHVRVHEMHEAGGRAAQLGGETTPVAGRVGGSDGGAVVAAVAAEDLRTACHHAGHFDGVLIGIGAAVGEEHALVEIGVGHVDQHLGQAGFRFGRVGGSHEAHLVGLLLDRVHDFGKLMAEIGAYEQRGHVGIAFAVVIPEIDAVGLLDGLDGAALLVPGLHDVLAVQGCDLFAGQFFHGCSFRRHIGWDVRRAQKACATFSDVFPMWIYQCSQCRNSLWKFLAITCIV